MGAEFCQLQLTCAGVAEASSISKILLEKKLIACAKQIPVSSAYLWHGKIEGNKEVLLVMDTKSEYFNQIEKEVAKIHSYDTFVLQMIPAQMSKKAQAWMRKEL